MIRIVVATDAGDVIGARDPDANARRFALVPPALDAVMRALYRAPILVGGAAAVAPFAGAPGVTAYALSRTGAAPGAGVRVEPDAAALARRLQAGPQESVVVGGLQVFTLFTPYADRLDRVVTDDEVPGDLVYDAWRGAGFTLQGTSSWPGGVTEHHVRTPGGPA